MHYLIILLMTVMFHKLSNALDTVCNVDSKCECNNNNVSCTKFSQDTPIPTPFILPISTITIHFKDVPIEIIKNNTFVIENMQSITWVASKIELVEPLCHHNLKYLDLSQNIIFKLSDDTFNNCLKLEYIDLSYNQLGMLSDYLFFNTKMLETVKLEHNNFDTISENVFKETINIKELSIGNSNFFILAKNALSNLNNLEYLNIENSRIEYLNGSSFSEHHYLHNVLLNNCTHLKAIDTDFISSAPNIENIELNNCGLINFLPPNIGSLKNLKSLQLFNTKIQPNCHTGWFSQWYNENNVIGYEGFKHFIENINEFNCSAKINFLSDSNTFQLTKKGIINCVAYGNPHPAITWLVPGGLTFHKNKEADTNISNHPDVHNWDLNQIDNQPIEVSKNGSLHILRMLRNNIGNYTCYASNKFGNDSKIIEVHLDSGIFYSIKMNALILGIASAMGFLMLTILCCAFKLLLIRLVLLK